MTSRTAQYCLAGRMWPMGRRLESPVIDSGKSIEENLSENAFSDSHQNSPLLFCSSLEANFTA